MTPICMARNLADDRIRELHAEADRRRVLAALPRESGRGAVGLRAVGHLIGGSRW